MARNLTFVGYLQSLLPAAVVGSLMATSAAGAFAAGATPMDVLVILTDDQRFDTVNQMPHLSDLAAQGVTFSNAYMSTPLCEPARASLYSGGYLAQNTGVLENGAPNGGAELFNDKGNLGAALQAVGYRTQFVGKWMNGYEGMGNYVPPGWSSFVGRHSFATSTSWSAFKYVSGTSTQVSGLGTISTSNQYTTYFERDQVLKFLSSTPPEQPFFVLWATSAPHKRATPAAEDAGLLSNYLYRGRGYGETDLSDKPAWVQTNKVKDSDTFVRNQLRTLQSVDRSVADLIQRLKDLGRLDNTLIIFTSDNGYMWGEHGLWAKNKAYEESLRVPFVVVMPGVAARVDESLVMPGLDIGPTVFELAGISRQTDGMSLVPLLTLPGQPWRTSIFHEANASNIGGNSIWAGISDGQWKYTKYWNGAEELYDLSADPYELNSLHKVAALRSRKDAMWTLTQQQLGLAIIPTKSFPSCKTGAQFSFKMKLWGGVAPFSWVVDSGQLPPGLKLNKSTGIIQGVPSTPGIYKFSVRVTDSSFATQAERARTYATRTLTLTVGA